MKGNMLNYFENFLPLRWTKVCYENTTSSYKQTKVGLPQGAISSTSLFNIYINNCPNTIRSNNDIKLGMFADDVVIWTSAKNNTKKQELLEQTMNTALNNLNSWATEYNMIINTLKTVYQFFFH